MRSEAFFYVILLFNVQSSLFYVTIHSFPDPGILGSSQHKLWRSWSDSPVSTEPSLATHELNISVVLGQTAVMPCKVSNLEDKTVSWIRGKDLTVLAVDEVKYTGDERFKVRHREDSEEWILELHQVRKEDEGLYDCQINTHPKISTKIFLDVITKADIPTMFDMPVSDTGFASKKGLSTLLRTTGKGPYDESLQNLILVRISGERRIEIHQGDELKLTCTAQFLDAASRIAHTEGLGKENFIRWSLDDVPLVALFQEWKINIEESFSGSIVTSNLLVRQIASVDTGKISCFTAQAQSDSIALKVIEEESKEQHYKGRSGGKAKTEHPQHLHTLTSAVSSASRESANNIQTLIFIIIFMCMLVTNIAACYLHNKKW